MLATDTRCRLYILFLFKQKTAYEMRISDWSSDVCSSDLRLAAGSARRQGRPVHRLHLDLEARLAQRLGGDQREGRVHRDVGRLHDHHRGAVVAGGFERHRSEEHTSELQSLMRISYAVFCLKTKTHSHFPYPPNSQHESIH